MTRTIFVQLNENVMEKSSLKGLLDFVFRTIPPGKNI